MGSRVGDVINVMNVENVGDDVRNVITKNIEYVYYISLLVYVYRTKSNNNVQRDRWTMIRKSKNTPRKDFLWIKTT